MDNQHTPAQSTHSAGPLVFAIDPGTTQSGWVLYRHGRVVEAGVSDNHDLLRWVRAGQGADMLAIEMIEAMGMAVGKETFATVRWVGRFQQAWREPEDVHLVFRSAVKLAICGTKRAKDANIRAALIDQVGAPGTKKAPGPTYGVTSHAWQALGVAVTALEAAQRRALKAAA